MDLSGIVAVMATDQRRSRRDVFKAAGGLAGTVATSGLPVAQSMKKIFVLVHPAWHGGWCWTKVTPLLQKAGHQVLTPTLTGVGERMHLARPEVGLDLHVTDVLSVLKYEDLRDVILVGHSSSGAVVAGVADRSPERVAHIVYLDAFVPENGQCVFDLVAPERRRAMEDLVDREGRGWLLPRFAPPPWATIVRDMWGVTDEGDVRWMLDRLSPTPIGHFKEAVKRTNAAAETLPRTFIRCRRFPNARFDEHVAMAKRTAGWRVREMDSSHHPFITAPDELTRLLLEAAGGA